MRCGPVETVLGIILQEMSINRFGCVWDPGHIDGAGVQLVSCGHSHTLHVTKDNVVWVSGTRGSWTETESLLQEQAAIAALFRRIDLALLQDHNIKVVSEGNETSMEVSAQGYLYLWGDHTHHVGEQLQPFRVCATEFSHVSLGW